MYGRPHDTMSGAPLPLDMMAMNAECDRCEDPEGIRWRVQMIEEVIYAQRVKQYQTRAEAQRREQERSKRR